MQQQQGTARAEGAAGTSLPELAKALVAAIRKQPDIAMGNVVGSSVLKMPGILGVTSTFSPISAPGTSPLGQGTLILFSALRLPLLHAGRTLHRTAGAALLTLHGAYNLLPRPR